MPWFGKATVHLQSVHLEERLLLVKFLTMKCTEVTQARKVICL